MILELFYGEVTAAEVLKKKCVLPDAWEKIRSEERRNILPKEKHINKVNATK